MLGPRGSGDDAVALGTFYGVVHGRRWCHSLDCIDLRNVVGAVRDAGEHVACDSGQWGSLYLVLGLATEIRVGDKVLEALDQREGGVRGNPREPSSRGESWQLQLVGVCRGDPSDRM